MSHATVTFHRPGRRGGAVRREPLPAGDRRDRRGARPYAAGVLSSDQVVAGFGDPAVVFIASLFVVSEGLDASGVTAWAGQKLIARAGGSPRRLLVWMLGLIGVAAALITPNGSVAALRPVAVVMAVRVKRPPSTFLMPLAFSASAGSLLALTGSPVNVIVSEASTASAGQGFSFLSFALAGLPLMAGTIVICTLFGERLVPRRRARTISRNLSQHARTLVDHYTIDSA